MGTDVEVYEDDPIEGEIVEAPTPLTKKAAQALDKRIRACSDKMITQADVLAAQAATLGDLLEQAAQGQIVAVLEYPSWTAYVKDAVRFTPQDRFERKQLVREMSEKGASQRAIAAVLGISQKTVDRDLDGVESDGSVTTTAGKTYPKKKKPEPEQEPLEVDEVEVDPDAEVAPMSVNDVANEFRNEIDNVGIAIQAMKDVIDIDEFEKAAKVVANRYLNKLGEYISELEKIRDVLMEG